MNPEPTSCRQTILSPDRVYRYTLWREWDVDSITGCSDDLPKVDGYAMFIGLNPSTADETKDDPTIRKCIGFSKRWGYGALCMTNLFAVRDTSPASMRRHPEPEGCDNHHHLLQRSSQASIVIAAWGVNGRHRNRDLTVLQWLNGIGVKTHCLRTTKHGFPEHPLYVPYEVVPKLYAPHG